jgi:hypothetical protein
MWWRDFDDKRRFHVVAGTGICNWRGRAAAFGGFVQYHDQQHSSAKQLDESECALHSNHG